MTDSPATSPLHQLAQQMAETNRQVRQAADAPGKSVREALLEISRQMNAAAAVQVPRTELPSERLARQLAAARDWENLLRQLNERVHGAVAHLQEVSEARDAAVRSASRAGLTRQELAEILGVTPGRIQQLLAKAPVDSPTAGAPRRRAKGVARRPVDPDHPMMKTVRDGGGKA
jgi:hypothetical protein